MLAMTNLVYQGSSANLQVLAEELRTDPVASKSCEISVLKVKQDDDSLYNGELAQIVISIATGVSATLISDAIHAAVDRARDRGTVKSVNQDPSNPKEEEAAGSDEIDQSS
jgi:hypothetical protein